MNADSSFSEDGLSPKPPFIKAVPMPRALTSGLFQSHLLTLGLPLHSLAASSPFQSFSAQWVLNAQIALKKIYRVNYGQTMASEEGKVSLLQGQAL